MQPDFDKVRASFVSVTASLPKNYLDENAARLLMIVEELRKSYVAELNLVQTVGDLDVSDTQEVGRRSAWLKRYVGERFFEHERTHCHNIARIKAMMAKPFETGSQKDKQLIKAFDGVATFLSQRDDDILDALEPLAADAHKTIRAIEKALEPQKETGGGDSEKAKKLQRAFVRRAEKHLATARNGLRELSQLSEQLIDIASGLRPVC
ncbi:MAG TPA: hypothetical protein VJ890_01365 [Vineibacter sp.]|nr:hypothetical protein [Vineibacter sp.]